MTYERKTGPGWAYIYCDVCGAKIRQKDAVLITDKYSTQYGLLVCKKDADKTNQQNMPFSVRETQVQNPRLLRSEPPDRYTTNENSNRVPGPAQNLIAERHPLNDTIFLQWQGPQDVGSDQITGYVITRASPQLSGQTIILADTGTPATSYEDITADITDQYTYTVRAINSAGTGTDSEVAFYPRQYVSGIGDTEFYLLVSQDSSYLTTSDDGSYIVAGG